MVKLKVNGVPVEMPYAPYPSQLVTMSKLLSCMQGGTSALIESPTGTGKSLAILCAVLGYNAMSRRESEDGSVKHPVFICSRTHSQLNQLVDQLRKTAYRPRVAVLGSKGQYCINPRLRESTDKNTACRDLVKSGGCVYFNGRERLAKLTGERVLDIEELRAEGRRCVGCPYYASRENAKDAEIVFLPYNYLIDSKIRRATDIALANAVVIIDEAHNIEDVCRTAGSLELTGRVVDIVLKELLSAVQKSAFMGDTKNDFVAVFEVFRRFQGYAESMVREESGREGTEGKRGNEKENSKGRGKGGGKANTGRRDPQSAPVIKKGRAVVEELDTMGIKRAEFKAALKSIAGNDDARALLALTTMQLLEEIEKVFSMLEGGADSYAFCFQQFAAEPHYSISLWLLDPGVVFDPLVKKVHAIALLSGTLTPFASFTSELRHTFAHQLVAPHVLRAEQVFIASVRRGHLGRDLCGTYQVAETDAYLDQIVSIIQDITRKVAPAGGTLVFVPNYAFLARLARRLPAAIPEPRAGGGPDFERALKKFQARITAGKDAVLLCVYRGKAAEGLNFQDNYARAVIAIGIPYPSIRDPQIMLKKEYNDNNGLYSGRQWYEAQAYRALNQALGRTIRHANDWGAIFLLDSRLAEPRNQQALASWVVKNIQSFDTYDSSSAGFNKFLSDRMAAIEQPRK